MRTFKNIIYTSMKSEKINY